MVMNRVLGFKSKTITQCECRTHFEVILEIESCVHHVHRYDSGRPAMGGINRKLACARSLSGALRQGLQGCLVRIQTRRWVAIINREVRKYKATIESGVGSVGVVNRAQAHTKLHEMLAVREGGVILKFVMLRS